MIKQDNKNYDVIIVGSNLQASLVFFQAANKGLKIALISENDFIDNPGNAYFHFIEPAIGLNIFEIRRRKKLIGNLKKSLLHLFISSQYEFIQEFSLFKKMILFLYKVLFNRSFKLNKYPHQSQLSRYSLPTNKVSIHRMIIALLRNSVQMGSEVYSHHQIKSLNYTGNKTYKLLVENKFNKKMDNLFSKKILIFDLKSNLINEKTEIADKSNTVVYFTYPSAGLSIYKNQILLSDNQQIKIISWFEYIYFEYINFNEEKYSLENALNFIQVYFNDIQIDNSRILTNGIYQMLNENKNKNRIQAILFDNEKQINIKFKPVNQWFNHSNKLTFSFIEGKDKAKNKQSGFGKIVFQGSDMAVSDNPLRIMEYADEKYDEAKQILNSPVYFKKLFYRYGTEVDKITEKAYQYWNETKNSSYSWLKAEMAYCIEHEFCQSVDDYIQRSELWMQIQIVNMEEIHRAFSELMQSNNNCS